MDALRPFQTRFLGHALAPGIDTAALSLPRESWRRFVMGSVESVARLVEAELSAKLESPVKLSFEGLWAHDLAGRAQAFKGMVAAGMSLERAVAISGLASMEE